MDEELKQIIPSENDQPLDNTKNSLSYFQLATSQNTRNAYQGDIKHFILWGGKLPATTSQISQYLFFYADKLNPRTLSRRLIAIKQWHKYQGFQDPTEHPFIKKSMSGIIRTHGTPKSKAKALSPAEIIKIAEYLDSQETLSALRDQTLILIGFFSALRGSELVSIQYEHLNFHAKGVEIFIPKSKTDQTFEGQVAAIPYGCAKHCPISILKKWLERSKIQKGYIFRAIRDENLLGINALSLRSLNNILKSRMAACKIDALKVSSHSLRRGLATSAAYNGASLQAIMRAGRWKQTNTVMEYIEASKRLSDSAASFVFNAMEE